MTRVRMSSNNSTGSTYQRSAEALGNLEREHGLAGPGLAFDQQQTLERDGGIDRDLNVVGRDIGAGPFETHGVGNLNRFSHVASTKDLPATPAPRFTQSSHEREPNCRDPRWQNALYTASDHPLAPTREDRVRRPTS